MGVHISLFAYYEAILHRLTWCEAYFIPSEEERFQFECDLMSERICLDETSVLSCSVPCTWVSIALGG